MRGKKYKIPNLTSFLLMCHKVNFGFLLVCDSLRLEGDFSLACACIHKPLKSTKIIKIKQALNIKRTSFDKKTIVIQAQRQRNIIMSFFDLNVITNK